MILLFAQSILLFVEGSSPPGEDDQPLKICKYGLAALLELYWMESETRIGEVKLLQCVHINLWLAIYIHVIGLLQLASEGRAAAILLLSGTNLLTA
jgi:hypothetical protein